MNGKVIGDCDKCFICGRYGILERHHCIGGSNRKNSETDGLCVMLCKNCHTGRDGVHMQPANSMWLKRMAQRYAMDELGYTIDTFRNIYGKNYL